MDPEVSHRNERNGDKIGGGLKRPRASPPTKSPSKKVKPKHGHKYGDIRLWLGHRSSKVGGDCEELLGHKGGTQSLPTGRTTCTRGSQRGARTPQSSRLARGTVRPRAPGPNLGTQAPFRWTEWAARSKREKDRTQECKKTKLLLRDKEQGEDSEL